MGDDFSISHASSDSVDSATKRAGACCSRWVHDLRLANPLMHVKKTNAGTDQDPCIQNPPRRQYRPFIIGSTPSVR
jgi:hypothetical protein